MKDFWHPLKKPLYALPHAVVLLALGVLLLLLGGLGGWFAGSAHTANYFEQKYSCTSHQCLPLPNTYAPVLVPKVSSEPATAFIPKAGLYPGVGNQGTQGACAAWVTAWDFSYLWRLNHPGSWLRFSPRQMYSHFSNTYNNGLDGGSWPDRDGEISSTTGLLTFKQDPLPPYRIDNPEMPQYDALGHPSIQDASKHRFYAQFTAISGYSYGGGQGLIDAMRSAIATGHPVMIGFPVYPEYDNATQQPNIVGPQQGESSRGGHENIALGYDDNRAMPDGTRGAFWIQNQWSKAWGSNGRAWMSYTFARNYVFGAEYATINNGTSAPKPPKDSTAPDGGHKLVPPPITVSHKTTSGNAWYVSAIYAKDRPGYRLDGLFNYWGDRYNLPPVGLAATFASECGFDTGVNGDCNRIVYPYDISGGGCQITVGTAQSLGIGDGSSSQSNINYVFNWEDNPANCVYGEATLMHQFAAYRGATYPLVNILWNCGPATTSYPTPYGQCATNYYNDFLGWYSYVIQAYGSPYYKKPVHHKAVFPASKYEAYRTRHHLRPISYRSGSGLAYGARLWWGYGHAGAVVSPEQFFRTHGRHGYMTQRFQYRRLYWTPGTSHVKWLPVRAIR
ncbi:MAG: C1 family peptidase [Acidobacteria bacterium]|nr:C1 family peptidase [Acidobacteriota bacterium]